MSSKQRNKAFKRKLQHYEKMKDSNAAAKSSVFSRDRVVLRTLKLEKPKKLKSQNDLN